MALSATPGNEAPATNAAPSGTPAWTIWLYLGGLVLVFAGERVFAGMEKLARVLTALGLLSVLVATALRFAPRFRVGGERRSIEKLLAALSATGLIGLLIYFFTEGAFAEKIGIDTMPVEKRDAIRELSRVVWVSLIVLSSVPMVFVETALKPMRSSERPESRRVRAAATAGVSLALAAIYCSLIVYAASGLDLRVDYSYFRTSRPSDSTRKYIENLGEPLRVVAFFPEVNEVKTEVAGYLRELASGSPKLKLEIHDRLLVPKLAKEMRVTQDGTIVLSKGSQTQTMTLGSELEAARPKLKTLDRDFQEQLVKILHPRRTAYLTVGHGELNDVARGAGAAEGRSAKVVRELIQRQNFTIRDLGLAQGLAKDVPDDASVVISLGPTEPFAREELAALKRYADRGGKLILAADADAFSTRDLVTPDQAPHGARTPASPAATGTDAPKAAPTAAAPASTPTAPGASASAAPGASASAAPPSEAAATAAGDDAGGIGAEAGRDLAEVVGLSFSPAPLANERNHVPVRYNASDRTCLVTNSFSSHASVSTLSRNSGRAAVVLFGAGSLDKGPGAGNAKVEFPIRSMTGTFQDKNRNFSEDPDEKSVGVFNLAAAISRPVSAAPAPKKEEPKAETKDDKKDAKKDAKKDEPNEMRAFVLADADALSDLVMGRVVGNQILFVDGFRWLVGEESVQGLPNVEEDKRIEHTKQVDMNWFYATIFGIPGAVLGLGLLISRKSRGGGKR